MRSSLSSYQGTGHQFSLSLSFHIIIILPFCFNSVSLGLPFSSSLHEHEQPMLIHPRFLSCFYIHVLKKNNKKKTSPINPRKGGVTWKKEIQTAHLRRYETNWLTDELPNVYLWLLRLVGKVDIKSVTRSITKRQIICPRDQVLRWYDRVYTPRYNPCDIFVTKNLSCLRTPCNNLNSLDPTHENNLLVQFETTKKKGTRKNHFIMITPR